jgi:hypothetical protein
VSFDTTTPMLLTELLVQPANRGTVQPATGFYLPERDEMAPCFAGWGPKRPRSSVKKGQHMRLRIRGRVPADYYRRDERRSTGSQKAAARYSRPDG